MPKLTSDKLDEKMYRLLNSEIHPTVVARVREIVAKLPWPIHRITCGNGTYVLNGGTIELDYDDGINQEDVQELIYWAEADGRKIWKPVGLTRANEKLLKELCEIMDWAVRNLVMNDIVFNREEVATP